ncbi:hypothetical protein CDD80_2228 [Ophiocordyceps camponoti-rufipedis]|uniref:Uncharacterized protein n=1 Tax=Ophiocordyceps camponoti-rufipedis TaxID=2004952 RepID=A0A2C5Z885_9HYPO|nr:hypothetical protein CDD80_2228 [Ophiocordyceps camponoti-rufipedis]
MDTAKNPSKLVKVTRVLGRTGTDSPATWGKNTAVLRGLEWDFERTEMADEDFRLARWRYAVREDDILCLLESEREARRLR